MRDLITVITDASFCNVTNVGGWAAWIVCNGQRIKCSGEITVPVVNSTEAEIVALMHGLHTALDNFAHEQSVHLILQSDNTAALQEMKNIHAGNPRMAELNKQCHEMMQALRLHHDFTFECRHVKGHTSSTKGARFYVNNWCDTEAKVHMRARRKRVQGK